MSRTALLPPLLLGVVCLASCGKKKPEPDPTLAPAQPAPAQPATPPGPAQPRPAQPETIQTPPALTPLYRFWDTKHNEHVYTYGDGEPADWRKNPAFNGETVIGYAALAPFADSTPLFRAYCRDGRHYFSLTDQARAPDVERIEAFEVFVWKKPGDGRIPIHACILPDDKDAYFERDLQKVKDYTEGTLKQIGVKRKVVERMFYLYPTASAPSLSKQTTTALATPATSLPPLPSKGKIPVVGIQSVAATPDGKVTAVSGLFPGVSILDRTPAAEHVAFPTEKGTDKMLALAPNGQFVAASGGGDPVIRVWDVKTEAEIGVLKVASADTSAAFTPDGKTLVFAGRDEKDVKFWDTGTRKVVSTFPHAQVWSLYLTLDGKFLVTCGVNETRVWDLSAGGDPVTTLPDPKRTTAVVALTPDGKTLVFGTHDGFIKIWDVGSSTARVVIEAHKAQRDPKVASLAMSPDGKFVVSAGGGGAAGVWDVATGRGLAAAQVGDIRVYAVAITDGGKTLLTTSGGNFKGPEGSWKGGVMMWDLAAVRRSK